MDKLIKEDDEFILLKLTTGETLVATIRAEDEQTISIEYPFELKLFTTGDKIWSLMSLLLHHSVVSQKIESLPLEKTI